VKTSTSLPHLALSQHVGDDATPVLELTIGDALRYAAERCPDRPALVEGDPDVSRRTRWSYAELLAGAERRAWTFLGAFRPGDAVAVWAPNCAEWVFLEQTKASPGRDSMELTVVTKRDGEWRGEGLARRLTMERQLFLDDIDSLPAESQREVGDLVASLKKHHPQI
jgi:AMP-binding enzyme